MVSGGIGVKSGTRGIVRLSALLLPVLLIPYSLFIRSGFFDRSHYAGDTVLLLILLPWVALALAQVFLPPANKRSVMLRLAVYHVFAAAYILFVSGFLVPFIAAWPLILLISRLYFSDRGAYFNLAALAATYITDTLLHRGNHLHLLLLSDTMSVLTVFVVGVVIILLNRVEQADSAELVLSKAKESLQTGRINTLINNLADAVISTDEKGGVEVYNAAALNLLNTNESLNGRHINTIIPAKDRDGKPVDIFENLRKTRGMTVRDDLLVGVDDESIRLEITSSPIRSSYSRLKKPVSPDGYMLILRDVTKTKSLEEERDEFISVVSHELRTPITIAEGTISNVQLMAERGNLPPDMLERSLASAHEQVLFLARMVNDLSTLSRAERGVADTPEPINVRELCDDLYNEYAPQAEKKKLHFNLDTAGRLGTITASRLYLHELLQNFITNSIKYTKEGSVTLHVGLEGKAIRFEVKDTGIGISKSDQSKIFNKFYRSEDYRTRETGGTGLGLYVAAKLAKKLNTSIEVRSRLNHGSSFSITLPLEAAKPDD